MRDEKFILSEVEGSLFACTKKKPQMNVGGFFMHLYFRIF